MRNVGLCQSRTGADLIRAIVGNRGNEIVFLSESVRLERYLRRRGESVTRGRFRDREAFRRLLPADLLIVYLRDERRLPGILDTMGKERLETPVLVLHHAPLDKIHLDPQRFPWVEFVPFTQRIADSFRTEIRLARAKDRVQELVDLCSKAKKILILMQDDPDPDALASGLALRQLLGRNRTTAPLGSFGRVTRPENLAMMKLLDLEVLRLSSKTVRKYDLIAMVDTQPPHLRQDLPRVDVVIDHHPEQTSYQTSFKDVRNSYGATATIMTEYLRARGEKIHERLATALLYAIRTDTLLLERNVTDMDVAAFTYLYPRANLNHIRRIEKPELPVSVLTRLADGLKAARIADGVIFSHLGKISREDVIPQLAEFCLQVEGVEWSVVSGIYRDELIMSVRNVGFVQAAGSLVKAAYQDLGSAGGHRSMAKAIIPLSSLKRNGQGLPTRNTYAKLEDLFLARLRSESKAG